MTEQVRIDHREVMVQCFIRAVQDNVNLVVLVSDSTSTAKIAPFQEKYPDRLINVGIAEQNLVGVAAGLSLGGYVAVTANAACFLVARANEQVKNDVCYSDMNVKLVGLNAGVSYGPLASTHHAIDDISIMRGLGNIIILAPSDPIETERIFDFALRYVGPVYIRMDNAKFPLLHSKDYQFELGKVDVLTCGDDISIFATGSVVHEAYAAAQTLKADSINAEVINVSSIRPVDKKAIFDSIRKTKKVITVEEHSLHGGLGNLVCEIIAEEGLDARIVRLGITQGHFAKAGPREQIRAFYKIDKNGILETARKLLRKG
ncbi:MAG: transketolase [Planctomycetes bacterium RBG_13_44_8b]|nr:MAG: transketolase [Planctomycetes bacterium RBG_13_44_8b]